MVFKYVKYLLLSLIAIIVLSAGLIQLTGYSYFWRALSATYLEGKTTAHIDDANNFAQRIIEAGPVQEWNKHPQYNQKKLSDDLTRYLNQYKTAAFLVVHRGELLHEQYFSPYNGKSRTNSFSVAKTITTMQVGMAVDQGYIASFDAPITDHLPQYKNDPRGQKATVAQLSSMKSGHDWTENYYLPLNITTHLYFGKDARQLVWSQGFEREPGVEFEYSSGSTQLLGVLLENALKAKDPSLTISQHLSRSLWTPLGMSSDAIYTLDRDGDQGGIERTYCCIFATAKDFAKLGQLLLQDGAWRGQQLLKKEFVDQMRQPDLKPFYGHSLWMDWKYKHPFYLMQGHQGQYVIIVPSKELVVVRLGQF